MNENPNEEEKLYNGIRSLWGRGDSVIPFALTQCFPCSSCTTETVQLHEDGYKGCWGCIQTQEKHTLASADLFLRPLKMCSSKVPLM